MLGSSWGARRRARLWVAAALAAATVSMVLVPSAGADGSETLGPPTIEIASGSGHVAAGTGTQVQPAAIEITVPDGVEVRQVLVYWEGQHGAPGSADSSIVLDGDEVEGQLIGGPNYFFSSPLGDHYSSTFRADVTRLGLVAPGANTVGVSGLDFDRANGGAGLLVIYSDGSSADIAVRDGNDLAFRDFPEPRRSTVAQTFAVAPAAQDRTATLTLFASSVHGPDFPGQRPSVIYVSVGGTLIEFVNVLASNDGDEWDTFTAPVPVPAGATSVEVQILSADTLQTGALPASLTWNAAALSVPRVTVPPPPGGGTQGCTPGYWRQAHHLGSWVGYSPADSFAEVFGVQVDPGLTLSDAVALGGGGANALSRHAVAALLNASNPAVDYRYSVDQVIARVQAAFADGGFEAAKQVLEVENERGCPLGRAELDEAPTVGGNGPKVKVSKAPAKR